MNNFHDVVLPSFISQYLIGNVCFQTRVVRNLVGAEQRRMATTYGRTCYIATDCRLNNERYEVLNSFFRARQGRLYSFRLRDFTDYKLNNIIAIGDGVRCSFSIKKQYDDGLLSSQLRSIYPIAEAMQVTVGGEETHDYCLDKDGCSIRFSGSPPEGVEIAVICEFDVIVRFKNDELSYVYAEDGSFVLNKLELMEVEI